MITRILFYLGGAVSAAALFTGCEATWAGASSEGYYDYAHSPAEDSTYAGAYEDSATMPPPPTPE
jgi:hypothetical protein